MFTRERLLLRGLSGPLAALMLVLSVAVPVVERADVSHELAVESEHAPGTCPTAHDHTVCTQVGANQGAASDSPIRRTPVGSVFLALRSADRVAAPSSRVPGPPARAPPLG